MRDLVAIIIVLILVVVALAMATSLQWYRRGHERLRQALKTQGQTILAEVPVDEGLAFFSEDTQAFYWAGHRIPKHEIRAAHVLISGAPLSSIRSDRFPGVAAAGPTAALEPGTVERERWDVGIELENQTILVECGSIRQQVSQEMARRIFESVKQAIEALDQGSHHSLS